MCNTGLYIAQGLRFFFTIIHRIRDKKWKLQVMSKTDS